MRYEFDDNKAIGIDLGIKNLLVTSEGEHIKNPNPLEEAMRKLAKAQRELSRKTKGSRRYEKQRVKVARLHEHEAAKPILLVAGSYQNSPSSIPELHKPKSCRTTKHF